MPDIDHLLSSFASDEDVMEAIVAAYRPGLFRLATSFLQDADEAEDAIQQALLTASLNLGRYQPGSNFKAWLFTLTVNTCRGALRKRKARQTLASLLGRSQHQPAPNLEDTLLRDEDSRRLWSAVKRLDEKYRLVVYLRYEQEMAIAEIAQVLSIREKTVYTRLYEAFRQLRGQLSAEMERDWQDVPLRKEVVP